MGLFDFGPKAPYHRVTVHEYRDKVIPQLYSFNFHGTDIGIIEGLLVGHLEKGGNHHEGIDQKEFEEVLAWLSANRDKHTLSSHQISQFEKIMKTYMEKSSH